MSGLSNGRRVTMKEAANELGLTVEAIRKRIRRGTLDSDKGPDGRRYVYLDEAHRVVQGEGSELIEELRDRVRFLERGLEEERQARTEARRRHDTLMAQLMQRIPEIEAPREQAPEARESPETVSEGAEPRSGTGGPKESYERPRDTAEFPVRGSLIRPWWRRVLGG